MWSVYLGYANGIVGRGRGMQTGVELTMDSKVALGPARRYSARAFDEHHRWLSTPTTQYIQKDGLVEPPLVVIKLRK
jgi:hypothetical protein